MPFSLPDQRSRPARHVPRRRAGSLPRRVCRAVIGPVVAILVLAVALVALIGPTRAMRSLWPASPGGSPPAHVAAWPEATDLAPSRPGRDPRQPPRRAPPAATRWQRVLEVLDDQRAEAWADDEPELLDAVYSPGSAALRLDRRHLAGYTRRGLRVVGVRLDFARVRVLQRRATEVRLSVVDRLHEMTAFGSGGERLPLPRDRASRHRIVLRRSGRRWRIATVTGG